MRALLAAAAALPLAGPALSADTPSDTFKSSGAFFATCDARPKDGGERPPASVPCLSYVAGLIDGYTTAAIANGNDRPYCLPRPVTLVEMLDMLTEVIARGVPPETPTSAVFHIILAENFPCSGDGGDGTAPAGDGDSSVPSTAVEK